MSVIFYGCISIDGYLSGRNHDLTWLHESGSSEETSYEDFYKSVDIVIMGRNSFDEIAKMASLSEVYPSTENYVFTSRDDVTMEGVTSVSGDVVEFVRSLDKGKNIWVVGGGGILAPLLEENLVDRLYLQFAPVIIGGGIPLFVESEKLKRFTLSDVKKFGQFAELIYDKIV